MTSKHFRCLTRYGFDLDAHFHTFSSCWNLLVIAFNWSHYSKIFKLQKKEREKWDLRRVINVFWKQSVSKFFLCFLLRVKSENSHAKNSSIQHQRWWGGEQNTYKSHTTFAFLICLRASWDNVKIINLMMCQRRKMRQFFRFHPKILSSFMKIENQNKHHQHLETIIVSTNFSTIA